MTSPKQVAGALMEQFESIGNSCEFGFVQSHFGVEPISLLRWSGCSLDGLVRGLENGFANLFLMENLKPVSPGLVIDTEYDITFHRDLSFEQANLRQDETNVSHYRRHARDIRYRLREFHEALAARERIFVYSTYADIGTVDLLRLKAALDLNGPQKLLVVVPASPSQPAQEVRLVASGVKIAAMVRTTESFPAEAIDFNAWSDICAQAALSGWGQPEAGHVAGANAARQTQPGQGSATDRASTTILASALYRTLLLREPNIVELANTVELALRKRMTTEQLIAHFLDSVEFSLRSRNFIRRHGNAAWLSLLQHVFKPGRR